MGAVLDQNQPVFFTDLSQRIKCNRLTRVVNSDYSFCGRCDGLFHLPRIDIIGFGVNVRKDRSCPTVERTVGRGRKSDRRGDDLVPLFHACCHRRYMKRRSAVGTDHCIPGPGQPAEFSLQLFDLRPAGQVIAFHNLHHSLNIRLVYILMPVINRRLPDGLPALYRRSFHV